MMTTGDHYSASANVRHTCREGEGPEVHGYNVVEKRLDIMVNKKVWMDCFGRGVPTEDVLVDDIRQLKTQLDSLPIQANKQTQSRLCNSLQRYKKMLAAVKDGQPWAWMLYPSEPCNRTFQKTSSSAN